LFLSLIFLYAVSIAACVSANPENIWRVEVGPPGNEFYQAPEAEPPPEALLNMVERIAPPYTMVKRWELLRNKLYFIRAEAESEEYDFVISSDGTLIELEYENDFSNVQEQPGELILVGTKRQIPLDEVPQKITEIIREIFPDAASSEAWFASTVAGPRYVVVVDKTAFYSRPDGQIQAAGLIENGALNEIAPRDLGLKSPEDILEESAEMLSPYKEGFNFGNQIRKLGKGPASREGAFRFVVMGDSRSNPDLWTAVIKHIDSLNPTPGFILNTGDIVRHGYAEEYREYFIPPLQKIDIPFLVAIGNHDDGDDGTALEYRYLFGTDSLNYYFDYGNWRFIFVDNVTSVLPYDQTLAWLERVLSGTPRGTHAVVLAHKPIATVEKWAYHSWDNDNSDKFAELMSKYRVNHVFFGHIHAYSTADLNGIPYTITGGGGAGLHDRYGPQGNVHHYLICDASSDGTLEQQVVRFYRNE
jgi:hypothetical protein